MAGPAVSTTLRVVFRRLESQWLPRVEAAVLVLGAVGITLLIGFHVAARWAGVSVRWTEEAARLVTLWATFFAVPIYLRHRRLLAVDVVLVLLPVRVRAAVQLCIYALIGAVSVVLVVVGYRLALMQWAETSPGLTWPMTMFSLPIPIFSALMLVHLVPLIRDEARLLIFGERPAAAEESGPGSLL
jgi:TRAP-type C4-dicarboxylate transport system permease small subunit